MHSIGRVVAPEDWLGLALLLVALVEAAEAQVVPCEVKQVVSEWKEVVVIL